MAGVRELLPEAVQLRLGQATLHERPRVDARRGVALEVDLVAAAGMVAPAEEVVEADLEEAGRAGVRGDVAAGADARPLRPVHHDGGVPPDVRADAPLGVLVAREPRLPLRRDRVDVVRRRQRRHADLAFAGALQQAQHDVAGALAAALVDAHRPATRSTRAVSSGSMSGSWLGRPSLITGRLRSVATGVPSWVCLRDHRSAWRLMSVRRQSCPAPGRPLRHADPTVPLSRRS